MTVRLFRQILAPVVALSALSVFAQQSTELKDISSSDRRVEQKLLEASLFNEEIADNQVFSPFSAVELVKMMGVGATNLAEKELVETLLETSKNELKNDKSPSFEPSLEGASYDPPSGELRKFDAFKVDSQNFYYTRASDGLNAATYEAVGLLKENFSAKLGDKIDQVEINKEIEEASGIKDLFSDIDGFTEAVWANTVKLKASWTKEFKEVAPLTFKITVGANKEAEVKTKSISQMLVTRYSKSDELQVVEIPLGLKNQARGRLVIFQPAGENFKAGLVEAMRRYLAGKIALTEAYLEITIPTWTTETETDLSRQLTRLQNTFAGLLVKPKMQNDGHFGGFLGLQSDAYITEMKQKAEIEVTKAGISAAAASGAVAGTRSLPAPAETSLVVDSSFGYLILHLDEEQKGKEVLFGGVVVDPSQR